MAFLDGIGKKLSQAGQTAVQKTREMTDIARINGLISEEEKKVNNNYYQIGKLYVAKYQTNYESEFAGMISVIRDSEMKIKEYKQQIQTMRGVVRCEQCGAEVESGIAFCSSCGAPMPRLESEQPNENLVKCSGCGTLVDRNMRFCVSCGKPMVDITQSVPYIPANQPVPPQTAQQMPPYMAYQMSPPMSHQMPSQMATQMGTQCPHCGAIVEKDSAFCTECGKKII